MTSSGSGSQADDLHDVNTVIDASARVQEQVEDLLEFMPEDSAVRKMVEADKLGGNPFAGGYSGYADYDYRRADGGDAPLLEDREVTESIPPSDVEEIMSDLGIDIGIVHPTIMLGLGEANNRVFASEAASAYNDWLLGRLDDRDRLAGTMVVAPHRPSLAAEEIERVGDEKDIVGVTLPSVGNDKPLGHERYSPIYEAAEGRGLPISIHAPVSIKPFRNQVRGANYFSELYTYEPVMSNMRELISLLFEGVPEFFPDLEFVMHGAGLGWVPYAMYRIDDHYLQSPPELPALSQLPSKHIKNNFSFGTRPIGSRTDTEYLGKVISMVGPERVLFTSDVPHPVTDTPRKVFDLVEEHLNAEELEGVMGNNAKELYGL